MKKITALIPCFNEESAIGSVIEQFPREELHRRGYSLDIIVIDNNSTDRTVIVAEKAGARVIRENKQGKGNAIRAGFYAVGNDTDYVVMLDGDLTYQSSEILRLIEPLESGFADVIVGSRMAGKMSEGAMSPLNHLGNWFFSFLVRTIYQVNVTDVLTGYFAWKREASIKLRPHIKSTGFAIEMEMITKMAKLKLAIYSVPITYEPRIGGSSLRPLKDGLAILRMFIGQLNWNYHPERIAFVTDAIYPFNKGGKERRLHEVVKRLKTDEREIHIYTMQWWEGERNLVKDDIYFHGICKRRAVYTGGKRSIAQALIYSLACFKLLFARFDILDADQIPVFPLFTMRLVCWIRRKKMFTTWYEVWGKDYWTTYLGWLGYVGWLLEYLSFKLPDVIISISEHTTNDLLRQGVKKDVKTVPLGVDLASILNSPTSTYESDIVYVGRLLGHKNVDMVVRATAKLRATKPDISCLIIGEGPERHKLEKLSKELGIQNNVTFMDFIEDSTELYGLMKASKIFVFPSSREGFGLIALEASACGLPLLTLDHPNNAATHLVHAGENGYLFKSERALVRLLKQFFTSYPTQDVSTRVGEYDWSTTADLVQKAYVS